MAGEQGDVRKTFFFIRTVEQCSRLPTEVVKCPALKVFSTQLDKTLSNLV